MFIQTESTPNPSTLKFLPGQIVHNGEAVEFLRAEEAQEISVLAVRLFEIDGVSGVFFGYDFITITKKNNEWPHMKPAILGAIMEHFMSGQPAMDAKSNSLSNDNEEFFDESDRHIVDIIKELLDSRVRPAVAQDGGDITFRGFKQGVVYLNMRGACAGCPSSTATLKHGIQNLLRHFIPEVIEVEANSPY